MQTNRSTLTRRYVCRAPISLSTRKTQVEFLEASFDSMPDFGVCTRDAGPVRGRQPDARCSQRSQASSKHFATSKGNFCSAAQVERISQQSTSNSPVFEQPMYRLSQDVADSGRSGRKWMMFRPHDGLDSRNTGLSNRPNVEST